MYLPELGQRDRKIGFWVKKGSQRSEVYAEEIHLRIFRSFIELIVFDLFMESISIDA